MPSAPSEDLVQPCDQKYRHHRQDDDANAVVHASPICAPRYSLTPGGTGCERGGWTGSCGCSRPRHAKPPAGLMPRCPAGNMVNRATKSKDSGTKAHAFADML